MRLRFYRNGNPPRPRTRSSAPVNFRSSREFESCFATNQCSSSTTSARESPACCVRSRHRRSESALTRARDSQFQHSAPQRARFHPEHLGGAAGPFDAPADVPQDARDVAPLYVDHGHVLADSWRLERRHPGVADGEDPISRHDDRALQDVLELAHVSEPLISLQHSNDVVRDRIDTPAKIAPKPIDEMVYERGNVLASLPQGRDGDWEHIQ